MNRQLAAWGVFCALCAPANLQPVLAEGTQPAFKPAGVESPEATDLGKAGHLCSHAHAAHPELLPGCPSAGPRASGTTDIIHYRLEIEILPQLNVNDDVIAVMVHGTNTIDANVLDLPISTFTLDLYDSMNVIAVTGDVSSWVHANNQIEVTLDRTYDPAESFQVVVEYDGEPTTGGFGAFKWWIQGGNLAVATLSEPYYAPVWWPCKDSLSDKSTMQMIVTVPDPMIAVSNGVLEATTPLSGNRTQFSWRESNPMANYLASLAITNYERYDLTYEYDDGNGGTATMPVPCYLYPEHWDFVNDQPQPGDKAGCEEMLDMLSVFESQYGPYPFRNEKYGVAETGGASGLQANMEHQTISSMYRVNNYSDIMAHEMAHHWFGDNVTCATWNDIWLNEGLTSYAEAIYREFKPGGGVGSYWARMNARRPGNPAAVVYRQNTNSVGAIFSSNDVYDKGAWVGHMLRHVMGDAAFFQGLADYRATYEGGFATTADFAASMSNTFGHDLSWFIDEWVMSFGAPRYEWSYYTGTLNGTIYLYLSVAQLQGVNGQVLFTMPIDIAVTTGSGTTVHRIWNDDWTEYYVIPIDGPINDLTFDQAGGVSNRNYILTTLNQNVGGPPLLPPVLLDFDATPYAANPGDTTIFLSFSEDIGALDAGDFELTGATTGAHAASNISYSFITRNATLTFSNLPNDAFTLKIIADNVTANGLAMDGEIDDSAWYDDVLLPSGDGQPGGDAVLAFEIPAGDANCDLAVDVNDIAVFTAVLLGTDTNPCHVLRSDANNDGDADGLDVADFVEALLGS